MKQLTLSVLEQALAVCRLPADGNMPSRIFDGDFYSVTKTADELSIVCPEGSAPAEAKIESGWRAFKVEGPLDFALTGILASLANPLAEAGISIFAISTFDTDYLLVKSEKLGLAREILSKSFTVKN